MTKEMQTPRRVGILTHALVYYGMQTKEKARFAVLFHFPVHAYCFIMILLSSFASC